MDNLNLAFDIAEKYLDIPKMLDAEGNIKILAKTIKSVNYKLFSDFPHFLFVTRYNLVIILGGIFGLIMYIT